MKRHLFTVFAAVFVATTFSSAAPAQGLGCGGVGFGYGFDFGALYNGLGSQVPHFAAHPPVYYSYPVPRPYGYSPFAYPPYVQTPEILDEEVEPATVINPYVPSSEQSSEDSPGRLTRTRGVQPLVIENPYVDQRTRLAHSPRE